MKKTLFILIILMPVITLGQDKTYGKKSLEPNSELEKHPLWIACYDSERNRETILIDDRNFSKSLINFDFDKSYNLSFIEKTTSLFRFIDDKDSAKGLLESEPFLEFKWQLRKSN